MSGTTDTPPGGMTPPSSTPGESRDTSPTSNTTRYVGIPELHCTQLANRHIGPVRIISFCTIMDHQPAAVAIMVATHEGQAIVKCNANEVSEFLPNLILHKTFATLSARQALYAGTTGGIEIYILSCPVFMPVSPSDQAAQTVRLLDAQSNILDDKKSK